MADLKNLGDHTEGTLIAESQAQKATTSNSLDNLLSDATQLPLDITITANRTLTDDEFFGHNIFNLSGSPAADFSLFLPATGEHQFIVRNNTGKVCTIDAGVSGGTVVELRESLSGEFHSDGTSVIATSDPDVMRYNVVALDETADFFLFWDVSTGTLRRILGENLPGSSSAGTGAFPFKGALVTKSANQSIPNTTFTAVTFDQEEEDTDTIHDNVTNNTRLTVPAGVTRVRLIGNVSWAVGSNGRIAQVYQNGAAFAGNAEDRRQATSSNPTGVNIKTYALPVVPGDYFELMVHQDSGGALNVLTSDNTWFAMEIVETTESGLINTVQTTDATPTTIATGAMAADSAHTIRAYGQGREDATGDTYHFDLFGGARNEGGTSSAPATPVNVREIADAGAATWDITLVANDTSDEWELEVTGEAAHTIDWTITYFEIVQEV